MRQGKTYYQKGILRIALAFVLGLVLLIVRLGILMIYESDQYFDLAEELHTRERSIKAARGLIYDSNGVIIATNRTVCTISVIHSQITEEALVGEVLSEVLNMEQEEILNKIRKISAREIIKTNVEKELGDKIREYHFNGVKVDEDYKRFYPYGSMASKVLGFTGADNQGIIGLEVEYENYLKGVDGSILTFTDAAGLEVENGAEARVEPISGNSLHLSLDVNIQQYIEQEAARVMEEKQAKQVSIVVMNPQNGELLAMCNLPEFDLNAPYVLPEGTEYEEENYLDCLNDMWRNAVISDTYEPGSAFKVITASAALSDGVVTMNDQFRCGGSIRVDDRIIRCHKVSGHGAETFLQGIQNSCNPVFITVGLRLGVERFYHYFEIFQLKNKTGVDLPGEASGIMHKMEDMKEVELATCSFGQSFQITPLRLLTSAAAAVNGGYLVTPHFGTYVESADGENVTELTYKKSEQIISTEVVEQMKMALESVVSEGGGARAYIEGYRIGGKTATSQKLPRGSGKYIAAFLGFAPADNPQVITLLTIDEPQGMYYGGVIAAPVMKRVYETIFPYLNIPKIEVEQETTEN